MSNRWQRYLAHAYQNPKSLQKSLQKHFAASQRASLGLIYGRFGARPDFLIIGTQKGGSTSLYRYLTAHPLIHSAAIKEIHYFSHHYSRPESWYRSHFATTYWLTKRNFYTGEASASYLFDPAAPARARALIPDTKLIVVLRNPVKRAFSHYVMSVRQGHEELSFAEAIMREPERLQREREIWGDKAFSKGKSHRYNSYLLRGHYAEQLESWFGQFPREQFLILSSEQFFENPAESYYETLDFLGLARFELPEYRQLNQATKSANTLFKEVEAQLERYFEPHNVKLEKLLGQKP